jgi:hypothetical protein
MTSTNERFAKKEELLHQKMILEAEMVSFCLNDKNIFLLCFVMKIKFLFFKDLTKARFFLLIKKNI